MTNSTTKIVKSLFIALTLLLSNVPNGVGQDRDVVDKQAFWAAAREGDLDYIKAAVEGGVDVDTATNYGATALMFAAGRGHTEVVEYLLDNGADANQKDTFYSASPMGWAAMKGRVDVSLLLVEAGAKDATMALSIAVRQNNAEAAKKLLDMLEPKQSVLKGLKAQLPENASEELSELFREIEMDSSPKKDEAQWKPTVQELSKFEGTYRISSDEESAKETKESELPRELRIYVDDNRLMINTDSPSVMRPGEQNEFSFGDFAAKFVVDDESIAKLFIEDEKVLEWLPVAKKEAAFAHQSLPQELAASSKNWLQFRGNGARGIAEGQAPPVSWDVPAGRNVLWKAAVEGLAHSCPIVVDDRLLVTTAVSEGEDAGLRTGLYGDVDSVEDESIHSYRLICFNKQTGERMWMRECIAAEPKVKRHLKSTHANCTPATDGQFVVAFFGSEGLYCYDMSGNEVWKKDFGLLDSGWFFDRSYQWEFSASPIIHEGKVFIQCDVQDDSFVACFSLSDGELVWRKERDEIPSWSTPTIVQGNDGLVQLVTNGTNYARSYDAATGEELWRVGKNSEIAVPTPFFANGLIYVTSGYRPIKPIYAINPAARGELSITDEEEDALVWNSKNSGPYMVTPVSYGGRLYTCNSRGVLECLDAGSGERIYRRRISTGDANSFVGSILAGDGHVYVPSEAGIVLVIRAGDEFELVAQNPLGESLLSTPAISEGVMYLRGEKHLVAVGSKD